MYTLSGVADTERGWGRAGETWTVSGELAGYDAEAPWFSLGDKDIATHLVRTRMLDAGYPLSAVTAALCERWQPGVSLLPMTDDRVETHVVVQDPEASDRARTPVRWRCTSRSGGSATGRTAGGVDHPDRRGRRDPAPGVLDAIAGRRPGADRAVQPGGVDRPDPRRPGDRRGAPDDRRAGGRGVAAHRRRPGARARRLVPGGHRRPEHRARPSAGTTAPVGRWAAGRLLVAEGDATAVPDWRSGRRRC